MSAPVVDPSTLLGAAVSELDRDAENARLSFHATGSGAGGVRVRRDPAGPDEPAHLDGSLNPVELALAALVSSQIATYRYQASVLGIPLDDVRVDVEGELDVRGFFGLEGTVRPGLDDVRIAVHPQGPAPAEDYVRLLAEVDARCPVLDLFRAPPTVSARLVTS
ncbi:OsmC family protein [Pseudonocardia sp. KRD291]|uniref:OsmC family protein n=1 Tax=Pseudonocardia sp. KRD291 TaxID=2792007 RepID=UPI001C49FBDD|nr:OsmC family protein [Pseudonocardia sp. KRD291]MBW0101202.1 OsmC family protein [Pseudonocardia sp. KRD291]